MTWIFTNSYPVFRLPQIHDTFFQTHRNNGDSTWLQSAGTLKLTLRNAKAVSFALLHAAECNRACQGHQQAGISYAVLIEDICTGCTNCALVCPEAIITVFREDKKTRKKEAVAELRNIQGDLTSRSALRKASRTRVDALRLQRFFTFTITNHMRRATAFKERIHG